MKIILLAICAVIFGAPFVAGSPRKGNLLGARECTWGPSYWCHNITNAKNCNAVRHCIQTVWEQQVVPEDNDSVCKICLDMVKQARDQLESNETQEELKEVFEGSCKLIPLKPVKKECMKLADDFIPELVEALASQMNPQTVCSVAGLCNNVAIDKMLAEYAETVSTTPEALQYTTTISPPEINFPLDNVKSKLSCSNCQSVASMISKKFHSAKRDDVLENMLHFCGKFSSFSDACSNIILSYFNEIYEELEKNLNSGNICHISGTCYEKYHQHPETVEITPMSNVGFIAVPAKDDLPCELCEQLVRHLRDLLVANTTEEEFKQVLEGLCKQTKGFKDECLTIVDQYYDKIYETLVNDLDENGACFLIGICPKGETYFDERPIIPLLPSIPPQRIEVKIKEIPKKKLLGEGEPNLTNEEIQSMQLPIDRLLGAPQPDALVENGQTCTLCEYFLHFVQEILSTPANEDKIKETVKKTCDRFPVSVRGECHNFVDMYGDAVIALLIQDIDPREICPMLKMCPQNIHDMEVFAPQPLEVSISSKSADKPTCPLCLFAVQQAQEMIKSDKTKENVRHALDNLCTHLPKNLQLECTDFVDTYSHELVEMLVTDFTPQQICVYIKLCPDSKPDAGELNIKIESNEDILTNEIPDNTVNGNVVFHADKEYVMSPECMICQRVIKEVESRVINKNSREQIKHALEHACRKLRKYKQKCEEYIEKHGDQIADLIMKDLGPKEVCRALGYCVWNEVDDLDIDEALKIDFIAIPSDHATFLPPPPPPPERTSDKITELDDDIVEAASVTQPEDAPPCLICEFVMAKLENVLRDKKTQDEIENAVRNICRKMPKTVTTKCNKFIDEYATLILSVLDTMPPKEICRALNLCIMMDPYTMVVTDEVVDCGVCHGAVQGVYLYVKEKPDDENIEQQNLIEQGCETLPAKYYDKCTELLSYYSESIVNLIRYGTDQSEICSRIGKCFKKEQSSWAFLTLTRATDSSVKTKRFQRSIQESTERPLLGAKKCTWGPSYWCTDRDTAASCKATEYCIEKFWKTNESN